MRFHYRPYQIPPSPQFPGGLLYRPMAQVRIAGLTGSVSFLMLLDTGADAVLLPRSIGDAIGVPMDESSSAKVSGIGAEPLEINVGEACFELTSFGERVRWTASVGFASFPDPDKEVGILGMAGALNLFTATFDGENREVELKPTAKLSRMQENSASKK